MSVPQYRDPEVLEQLDYEIAQEIRFGLRIALTNQPMTGVMRRPDWTDKLIEAYDKIGLTKYSEGLRSGSMIPVWPVEGPDRYYPPGFLFFNS